MKMAEIKGKTLIERSANAYERYLKAKHDGDFEKADKLSEFIEYCNERIRKGKK